jgi:hypothetical protein
MTRALLQQALDAMQEIYFYILSSNNNLPYKKLQEGIEAITAALAQPKPVLDAHLWGLLEAVTEGMNRNAVPGLWLSLSWNIGSTYIAKWNAETTPTAPEAVTYRNPADDVALKRSFEAMESTSAVDVSKYESEITMLRCDLIDKQAVMQEVITAYDKAKADLADMTAQCDRFKNALELSCIANWQIAEDRLDAQRYRWLKMKPSPGVQYSIMTTPWGKWDAAIDAEIATGGHP